MEYRVLCRESCPGVLLRGAGSSQVVWTDLGVEKGKGAEFRWYLRHFPIRLQLNGA